jgi:hypothetical protein
MRVILRGAAVAALAAAGWSGPSAAQDLVYDPYSTWNGYRIYLSPARHDNAGSRGECGGNNENDMAYQVGYTAATGDYGYDLRSRGYKVRVGRTTLSGAISNSNAWAAHIHVPLHSNASGATCTSTNAAAFGTNVIYYSTSTNGQRLADGIKYWVGYYSPGTNDYICPNPGHPCTTINLGELSQTKAVAAYSESEFHNWNTGVAWLTDEFSWSWALAEAIDEYLGYP